METLMRDHKGISVTNIWSGGKVTGTRYNKIGYGLSDKELFNEVITVQDVEDGEVIGSAFGIVSAVIQTPDIGKNYIIEYQANGGSSFMFYESNTGILSTFNAEELADLFFNRPYVGKAFSSKFVDELPETGEEGILYFVLDDDGEGGNRFNEYFWIEDDEQYELVGSVFTASSVGEDVSGQKLNIDGVEVTALQGAERFNDYTNNKPTGAYAHAEGTGTKATGNYSHAEGNGTTAANQSSHAEGYNTVARGDYAHAEGSGSVASASRAHAEGGGTEASGIYSHAEGTGTKAQAAASHAEGSTTIASGLYSHAEGGNTTASGQNSHAEGTGTIAGSESQHVQGKFNVADSNDTYAHIVGNGTGDNARSNMHTLDWNGVAWFKGGVKVGGTSAADASQLTPGGGGGGGGNVPVLHADYYTPESVDDPYPEGYYLRELYPEIFELVGKDVNTDIHTNWNSYCILVINNGARVALATISNVVNTQVSSSLIIEASELYVDVLSPQGPLGKAYSYYSVVDSSQSQVMTDKIPVEYGMYTFSLTAQ